MSQLRCRLKGDLRGTHKRIVFLILGRALFGDEGGGGRRCGWGGGGGLRSADAVALSRR